MMSFISVSATIYTIVFLSCFLQPISALVTFKFDNNTYSYSTQSPFQVKTPQYYVHGPLIQPGFNKNESCTLDYSKADVAQLSTSVTLDDKQSVIVAISEELATQQGCRTISHAGMAAYNFAEALKADNGLSVDAILYLLAPRPDIVPGAPHNLLYVGSGFVFPNDYPPIPMALLKTEHFLEMTSKSTSQNSPLVVFVQQELGPWNEAFFSGGYIAFICATIFFNVVFAIRGLISLVNLIISKEYPPKQPLIIFCCGLAASCLLTIKLPINLNSVLYKQLEQTVGSLFLIAYHLLFLLWHSILVKVKSSKYLRAFRMIIWAAFFGILTSEIIFYVFAILPINSATASALFVTTNIALTLRIVVIIGFIYHGTVFWLKRRICGMKTETLRVLDQLTIICAICVLGYFFLFAANAIYIGNYWNRGVAPEVIYQIFVVISSVLRIVPILVILDFRTKNSKPDENKKVAVLTKEESTITYPDTITTDTTNKKALTSSHIQSGAGRF